MKATGALGTAAVASGTTVGSVAAQELDTYDVSQTFVRLDDSVFGGLYEPTEETEKSHIAFVFMHPSSDYTTGFRNQVAERNGYRALGVDSHVSRVRLLGGQLTKTHVHDLIPDIGKAVSYMREIPEVETVILGGHSGGCHIMSLYQNIAENGVEIGQGDEKIYPLPDYLRDEDLPPADGLVLIDGHNGYAAKALTDLGPQLVNPDRPQARRPDVDMLNPDNGYNPESGEPSSYSDEFLDRFFSAQCSRMNELLLENQRDLEAIEDFPDSGARFPDDENFILLDTRSRVWRPDPSILAGTQNEWPLHHAEDSEVSDESVTEEQIDSVRGVLDADYTPPLEYHEWEVEPISVRIFLSSRAIRPIEGDYQLTERSFEGIDWNSANAQAPGNLETISVPLLITQATGHYFVTHGELFYNHAGSSDKTLRYVHGASHGFTPIEDQYGDTRTVVHNLWDQWAAERFV